MADRECPGCGCFYVPDEDDTCPECGCFVPKICPFCGAEYDQRSDIFCPSCHRRIDAYPREVYSWDEAADENIPQVFPDKSGMYELLHVVLPGDEVLKAVNQKAVREASIRHPETIRNICSQPRTCSDCGAAVAPGEKACLQCGHFVPWPCPFCGNTIDSAHKDYKYCPFCGCVFEAYPQRITYSDWLSNNQLVHINKMSKTKSILNWITLILIILITLGYCLFSRH